MTDRTGDTTGTLVKALSCASFGLGVSELVAPGKVAAIAGVDDTSRSRRVIRGLGVRECGHGAALLGGLMIGIIEGLVSGFEAFGQYRSTVPFLVILAVLMWSQRGARWDEAR